MDMKNIRKSLYNTESVGWLYSGATFLPLVLSLFVSVALAALGFASMPKPYPDWYIYLSYLLPQIAFAIAILLFFVLVDLSPKTVYRGAKWQYFLIAIVVQFGLFSLSGLNNYILSILGKYIGYSNEMSLPSLDDGGIVGVIFVVAFLPAVLEESIFRGLLLQPLKKFSTPIAVFLCGLLFSIYHHSPAQTVYQFLCGMMFALIAIRADSVLPTMLSHFLNNAVIIILYKFGVTDFGDLGGVLFYVISGIALVVSLVYLIFIDKRGNTSKMESIKPFLLTAGVGICVCVVLWLTNLLNGMGISV